MSTTVSIVKTPDVLHGKPRRGNAHRRIQTRRDGARTGLLHRGLLDEHPSLDREQVEAALEYYDKHLELMKTLRAQKRARSQDIREQNRAR